MKWPMPNLQSKAQISKSLEKYESNSGPNSAESSTQGLSSSSCYLPSSLAGLFN